MNAAEVLPMLPGEDLDSTNADDARHWTVVYGELLSGIRAMIRAGDADGTDRLQQRAELYARRLLYWRARR